MERGPIQAVFLGNEHQQFQRTPMLNRLRQFFSSDNESQYPSTKPAATTRPPVNGYREASASLEEEKVGTVGVKRQDNLIKKLTDDHRTLMAQYGEIKHDADLENWQILEQRLGYFQVTLTDHLLVETVKLYSYLKQTHRHDEDAYASIQDFTAEMSVIRKNVTSAIANFRDISFNIEKQKTFPEVWRAIGVALGNRIQREEKSLYPLY
jgi:hypothetical protein